MIFILGKHLTVAHQDHPGGEKRHGLGEYYTSLFRWGRKIFFVQVSAILLLAVLGSLVLSLPVVQTSLAKKVTDRINEDFGTNISIERVQLSLLSLNTGLKGIYIEDYKKDTLIYVQKLSTSILNLRGMANNKMEFGDIEVNGLYLNLKTYQDERFVSDTPDF